LLPALATVVETAAGKLTWKVLMAGYVRQWIFKRWFFSIRNMNVSGSLGKTSRAISSLPAVGWGITGYVGIMKRDSLSVKIFQIRPSISVGGVSPQGVATGSARSGRLAVTLQMK